ncbi:RNA dependent RNA polymerase-domain-containing protein [Mycena latifolia]|nr:RNA dependent RNA polymerase-domain-containing protein [Mycena latifolia]
MDRLMINVYTSPPRLKDTSPFIIAGFQNLKDEEIWNRVPGLPSGVSWEIARLVSLGRVTEVFLEDLKKLKGSNADAAPKTIETILDETARDISLDLAFAAERQSQCPWTELDLEELAMRANPNAALGNCPEYLKGYGGKVCFSGSVEVDKGVKVVLDRCSLTSSCRLCRRFGSSRFLRLKVSMRTLHSSAYNLKELFQRPFIIWGKVFRSFYAKEGTVILFQTRETYKNGAIQLLDSTYGFTLFEFLDQFNPLKLNSNQALCKWASRFALGLSNSVPGPVINPADVDEMDDISDIIRSKQHDRWLRYIQPRLQFEIASRFQPRFYTMRGSSPTRRAEGRLLVHFSLRLLTYISQGMLLLWPDASEDSTPKVAFRKPSQIKINYNEDALAHPANATIDILRFSRTKSPARISPEVIINLEHNGVPSDVFVAMQDAYIAEGVDALLLWAKEAGRDKPEDMFALWSAVEKSEGVYFARRVREAVGEARFRGLGDRDRYGDLQQDDDEEDPETFDKAIHERSYGLVAGLHIRLPVVSLPVLRDKLKQIVRTKIKFRSQHFKYDDHAKRERFRGSRLLGSARRKRNSFQKFPARVPDERRLELPTRWSMTRNPCKVPTDVRKLKAVKSSKLAELVDVIVCSVKGERRLLDFLAGGDYDGDTAIVIWDKQIVDSFVNAPEKYSVEPQGLDACFTRDETTVAKFIADSARKSPEVKAAELQKYLLGSLRDASAVGQYSGYHDNAIVTKGYDNPRTVKLAYQFCKILDSPKTGYVIKPETRNADSKVYGHPRGPAWKSRQKKEKWSRDHDESNMNCLQRTVDPKNSMLSRPFIMDVLNSAALSQESQWLRASEQLFLPFETDVRTIVDPDLTEPWQKFKEFAIKCRKEGDTNPERDLAIISQHVEDMYKRHSGDIKYQGYKKASTQASQVNAFTGRAIEVRQDVLRALQQELVALSLGRGSRRYSFNSRFMLSS